MIYILDSNIFIDSFKKNLPIDIFPSFWESLKKYADEGKIRSIDKVYGEVARKEDEVLDWIEKNISPSFFLKSEDHIEAYAEIIQWSFDSQYNQKAVKKFSESERADAWLIAFCKNTDNKLVTLEVSSFESKKQIKIPDVCNKFNIQCCSLMDMLRELNFKV